jgi:hypothetical protein
MLACKRFTVVSVPKGFYVRGLGLIFAMVVKNKGVIFTSIMSKIAGQYSKVGRNCSMTKKNLQAILDSISITLVFMFGSYSK